MDEFLIPPPSSFCVGDERPLLFTADGVPLKRRIGFAMQTSTMMPNFSDGVRKTITTKPPKIITAPKITPKAKPMPKGKGGKKKG